MASAPVVRVFSTCFGAFLGLTVLKFGNPPIMEKFVTAPSNVWEIVLSSPWPIGWAYGLLGLIAIAGLLAARWRFLGPAWLVSLPLVWLIWQLVASTQTIAGDLSTPTLGHFAACVACFYLGLFCLSHAERLTGFWLGISFGFVLALVIGWQQHFGGLAQTRQYFYAYIYPHLKEVTPEYLKKLSSTRIFSTLFYPNSLAGLLLLLLPPVLAFVGLAHEHLTLGARLFLLLLVTAGAVGCLLWSGSKGGWLIMLLLGVLAVVRAPWANRYKIVCVVLVLLIGLPAFFARYARFFERGATSVSARFDYWRAALQITKTNPLFGTGPGTFAIPYAQLKRPESEMSRLVHNDYLEQACDSGLPGFSAYLVLVASVLFLTGKPLFIGSSAVKAANQTSNPAQKRSARAEIVKSYPMGATQVDWQRFAVWLGLVGWSTQGLFEFGLYIPALAWVAFSFMGWLLGTPRQDMRAVSRS